MKSPWLTLAGAAIAAALAAGCSGEGCLDNRNSLPLAGFYSAETHEAVSISGLTVGGVGAPNDSLLLSNETAGQVYMPFRASSSEVTFSFSAHVADDMTLTDFVTFGYQTITYFDNADCGAMYRYRITSVTHDGALIDSIGIVDSLITNTESQRIKIFFHGSPE